MSTVLAEFLDTHARRGLEFAAEADRQAGAMELARSAGDFAAATAAYNAARERLLDVLLALETAPCWRSSGLGLLPVQSFLQQRDPALFGLYNQLRLRGSEQERATFACVVEAQLLVFPDRGPVNALFNGCRRLFRVPGFDPDAGPDPLTVIVTVLKREDFWVPQGTASLDALLKRFLGAGGALAPIEDASEETVREYLHTHEWSWVRVRDDLKFRDAALLRRILGFRRSITDSLMHQARTKTAASAMARYGDRFRWVTYSAPGSDRLTSDHDVSTRGTATENVVVEFNSLFRRWTRGLVNPAGEPRTGYAGPVAPQGLESAYVFDVNVYASDYNRDMGPRFLEEDAPDPDLWPHDAEKRRLAERHQDIYALLKIRRYVADDVWGTFSEGLSAELAGGPKRLTAELLAEVNAQWATLRDEIDEHLTANSKIFAENALYEKQLVKVEALRWNNGGPLDDDARVLLAQALGLAGFYAQEAYHSSGAVRAVVANAQQRKGLRLTDAELLCSLNEQAGDIFQEIAHLHAGVDPSVDLDFAVKTSKYMVRLGNVALGLHNRVVDDLLNRQFESADTARRILERKMGPGDVVERMLASGAGPVQQILNRILELQGLCEAWRRSTVRLLEVKDAPEKFEGDAGRAEIRRRIEETPWLKNAHVEFRDFLMYLVISVNVLYRSRVRAEAPGRFLKDMLAAAARAATSASPSPPVR